VNKRKRDKMNHQFGVKSVAIRGWQRETHDSSCQIKYL